MSCRVLVADPPWSFGDKLPGEGIRGAEKKYEVMSPENICRFPLPIFNPTGAALFLWRVSSQPSEALDVVRMWGFTPKSEIVWVKLPKGSKPVPLDDPEAIAAAIKLHMGMGRTVRGAHETCIVATRGKVTIDDAGIRTVFFAPVGEHSEKPDEFFRIVEKLFPPDEQLGAHVELFARKVRPNWIQYGNELDGNVAHPIAPTENVANPTQLTNAPVVKDGPGGCVTMAALANACTARGHKTTLVDLTRCSVEERDALEAWCSNETPPPDQVLAAMALRQMSAPPPTSVATSIDSTVPSDELAERSKLIAYARTTNLIPEGIPADQAWSRVLSSAPAGWFVEARKAVAGLQEVAAGGAPTTAERPTSGKGSGRGRKKKSTDAGEATDAQSAAPKAPEQSSKWNGIDPADVEMLRSDNGQNGTTFQRYAALNRVLRGRGYIVTVQELEKLRPGDMMGCLTFAKGESVAPDALEKLPRLSSFSGWFVALDAYARGEDPENEEGFWS